MLSKWAFLVKRTLELFKLEHTACKSSKTDATESHIVKATMWVHTMEVVQSHLIEYMQLAFRYYFQEPQVIIIDKRSEKTFKWSGSLADYY